MVTTREVIKELNSGTKIKILCALFLKEKLNVTEITKITTKTRINISKQVCELRSAGILAVESQGRNNYYTLSKDLDKNIIKLLKQIVNTYNIVDKKQDFVSYK